MQDDQSSNSTNDVLTDLPQIEDGGLDDRTIASPALGFGMEREEGNIDLPSVDQAPSVESASQSLPMIDDDLSSGYASSPYEKPLLSYDEVAAVSVDDRAFYVSDVATPYLSQRQADEDVRRTRQRKVRTSAILTTLAIVCVLAVGGWFLWQSMRRDPVPAAPEYNTATIEKKEFLETVDATTLLKPADEQDVNAGISGTIAEMFVQEGGTVSEGDPICRLDNPTITDSYNKARAAYDSAQADVEAKTRALNEANNAVVNAQNAAAAQSQGTNAMTPQTSVSNAQSSAQAAQNELNRVTASLSNIEATLQRAQEQQDLLTVYAPISGTVNGMNTQLTNSSTVTGSTHICTITDVSKLGFEVEIPEDCRGRVNVGTQVRVKFPSISDLDVVATIASFEDGDAHQFANVVIENPDPRLTKGLAAEASVIVQSVPDSLIVPLEAIQRDQGNTYLEVLLDPTRDIKRNIGVEVVATNKTHAAVKASNIQEGNTVIIPDKDAKQQSESGQQATQQTKDQKQAQQQAQPAQPAEGQPAEGEQQPEEGQPAEGEQVEGQQPVEGEQPAADQPAADQPMA